VSLREGPLGDIRVPLTWSAATALVIAVIIAAAFLLSHQRDPVKVGAYDAARRVVDAVAAPVDGALAAPVRWTKDGVNLAAGYFFAVSENRSLKAELAHDQATRDELAAVTLDNQRLRAALGIKTDPPLPEVAAETIAESQGPFANTRLADAGADKGVLEGNPVLSEHGLVGRIVGVSAHVSRILLLTDTASRTPVILMRTNGRAILTGDGSGSPKLDYVRTAMPVRAGDRVLTSGDGGVFPRGLPVGTVVKGFDGSWRVALDSDTAPIDYVQILLFTDFSQLVDQKALAPKSLPTAMTEEPSQSIVAPASSQPAKPLAASAAPVARVATPKPKPEATARAGSMPGKAGVGKQTAGAPKRLSSHAAPPAVSATQADVPL
jgi:rod shape-determining protein MreC